MKTLLDTKLSLLALTMSMSLTAGQSFAKDAITDSTDSFKDKVIIICEPDDLDCDNPPVYPILPRLNGEFNVYRTGGSSSVEMRWDPAYKGNGFRFRYEVYKEVEGSTPQVIYFGQSNAFTYNAPANETARFTVKACSHYGCSVTLQSPVFTNNIQPTGQNAETLPVEQIKGTNTTPWIRTTGEQLNAMAVLGNGYDEVRGQAHGNHCWDTFEDDKIASTEALNQGTYTYEHTTSYETMMDVFDRNTAYGLSLSFGGFTAGVGGTAGVFGQSSSASYSSVIAASYRFDQTKFNAKQADQLGLSDAYAQKLYNGEKYGFRTSCGDKYIDSITTGAIMNFAIRLVYQDISNAEARTTTGNIGIDINNVLNDGILTHEEINAVSSAWGDYKFDIALTHAGFTNNDAGSLVTFDNIEAFLEAYQDLLDRSPSTAVVIDSTQRFYPIPAGLGDDRYSVFVDPNPFRDRLNNWALLDQQVAARCSMLDEGSPQQDATAYATRLEKVKKINSAIERQFPAISDQRAVCSATKALYNRFAAACSDQGKWGECYAPEHSACIDNNITGRACMDRPERIYAKYHREVEENFTVAKNNCIIGPCVRSASRDICFEDAQTVPDYWKESISGEDFDYWPEPEEATAVYVITADARDIEATNTVKRVDGKYCTHAWGRVRAGGVFGDARYSSDITMFGYYLTPKPYEL